MLRSTAFRMVSCMQTAMRDQFIRAYSSKPAPPPPKIDIQKLGDKHITPPLPAGFQFDVKSATGEQHADKVFQDVTYTKYPGSVFPDGKERTVWDKLHPTMIPNPSIMHVPAHETDDEFDQRFINYFNRPDIDGWELRKALKDLLGNDLVPEPAVTIAALHAMRRLNEHSMCVRWLEAVKWKSSPDKEIWPWMMQELQPTLDELGISTLEEMGYDKPELWKPDVQDM